MMNIFSAIYFKLTRCKLNGHNQLILQGVITCILQFENIYQLNTTIPEQD